MDRITIVGMGPIGVSIALGLKRAGLKHTETVGTGKDRSALYRAAKLGAFDVTTSNLGSALDGAQMVVLDTPLAETKELLEAIGQALERGCVVTDTGMAKEQVIEWAQKHLDHRTSFVAGRPLLKQRAVSLEDADAGIFQGTDYCVVPAEGADPDSVKAVVGLVESLGATPLFLTALEHDSYTAAVSLMPAILSSALVGAAATSPSWKDLSRFAGHEFRRMSENAANDPAESADACLASPETLIYWLDRMIGELSSYRGSIEEGSDDLLSLFAHAQDQRARWEAGVTDEGEGPDIPGSGAAMAGLVLSPRLVERYRQITRPRKPSPRKHPGAP